MKRGLHEHDSRHIVFENYNYTVSRDEFVSFIKFYMKDVTDTLASDIYMFLNKRLHVWLNESPKKK